MKRFTTNVLIIGAAIIMIAIMLGAFAAHALRDQISGEALEVFKTGVQYQLTHGFAILICGLLSLHVPEIKMRTPVILFALGILFFSGSLYLLSTQEITHWNWAFLGPITPIGGLLFIIGWILFIWQIVKKS